MGLPGKCVPAERVDTPDLAENGASGAVSRIKSGSPRIPLSTVSTKTNAGDQTGRDAEGGTRGFNYRMGILGSEGRQPSSPGQRAYHGFARIARGTVLA
jgi:hypothetical protein